MELYQLRTFAAVAEEGHLTRAAERLHISQPAVSGQIKALEQELDARLFERSSRGVALTEAGRVFLVHAKVVLADAERARHAVRESASLPSGEVALGLPTTVMDTDARDHAHMAMLVRSLTYSIDPLAGTAR